MIHQHESLTVVPGHVYGPVKSITYDGAELRIGLVGGTDPYTVDPACVLFRGRPMRSVAALLEWWAWQQEAISADLETDEGGGVKRALLFPRG